ncbi:MAG TPA: SLC13 family permease [Candidatus Thermoplasmatota archaeon]|nr:SLC13 family permease [Candidatus Thermoplasmatota archaeon]
MPLSIIILAIVFILIAIRKIGNFKLQIWQIMLFGAIAVLVNLQITPWDALKAINVDVLLFLFGMFIIGQALEDSGYLAQLSYRLFKHTKSMDVALLAMLFVFGFLAALLMNDTLAIIGTPVVLLFARRQNTNAKLLLLTLAFSVTIGSVMSPIGNPQNLLIAINGSVPNPFITFLRYLFLPTILNLVVAYAILKVLYRKEFKREVILHHQEPIKDAKLAFLSKVSLVLVIVLVIAKIIIVTLGVPFDFRLTYIALIGMLPVIIGSSQRMHVIKRIDWSTLVFFAAMFVLMQSVWNSGFFQALLQTTTINLLSIPLILFVSIVLSQFISNVPLVALYLPLLLQLGATTPQMIALAAGSTIAGNLFILGAASNVIIIQNAEKKTGATLTFLDFAKVGIPLTIVNTLIYWLFLSI